MNEIKRWGEKFIVLLVVLLLIFPFDLPSKKQKKGARLEVQKKDGEIVIGELLQVKEKSLLLRTNSETGVTIDINEIDFITIIKKSKVLKGAGWGVLIGGGIGVLIGIGWSLSGIDESELFGAAVAMGIIFAIPASILGAIVGAVSEGYKIIHFEGKSQGEINGILLKLKKKARIKN